MSLEGCLLSLLIWLPIVGGFIALTLNDRATVAKWLSLIVSGLSLALCVPLWASFKIDTAAMQFVTAAHASAEIRARRGHGSAGRCGTLSKRYPAGIPGAQWPRRVAHLSCRTAEPGPVPDVLSSPGLKPACRGGP